MPRNRDAYNVIVIGGGTAGLVTAAGVAGLGGRVALIERRKMGGDCLNYGCVPSKALIASARRAQEVRDAERYGLRCAGVEVDFSSVIHRVRERRARIEPHDSRERFESLGVHVYLGKARFRSAREVEVDGRVLRARHVVIATGTRPHVPRIPGIDEVPFFTNETLFDQLDTRPERMAIIGGGVIGCELAQAFARLGVRVHLIQRNRRLLMKEDPDAAAVIEEVMRREGVDVRCSAEPQRVRRAGDGIEVTLRDERLRVDALLIAAGRVPNVESLNLPAAGVETHPRGVGVNSYLQTTQRGIFAAGDVTGQHLFTHVADAHARTVVRNTLFPMWKQRFDDRVVPRVTYTDPEVAAVGLNEADAGKRGIRYDVWAVPAEQLDRAVVADETEGFARVLTARGSDHLLGATLVCANAGELLHELVLAMKHGVGLSGISDTIHAYPTLAEVCRKAGDAYQRSRLTPRVKRTLTWWWRRQRRGIK